MSQFCPYCNSKDEHLPFCPAGTGLKAVQTLDALRQREITQITAELERWIKSGETKMEYRHG